MFNYIKADLYRLAHKKSNYVYYGLLFLAYILMMILTSTLIVQDYGIANGFLDSGIVLLSLAFPLLFGIQAYSAVYLNDLSSNAYQNIFSNGLSKIEFIIGKLIVLIVYLFTTFVAGAAIFVALYFFFASLEGTTFDTERLLDVMVAGITIFLSIIGYAALANLVAYITQNTTMSLITFGVLIFKVSTTALNIILIGTDKFEFLRDWTMSYYVSTANEIMLFASFTDNGISEVLFKSWGIILLYTLIASVVGYFILNKVEIKEGK